MKKKTQHFAVTVVRDMPVMLSRLCLAAYAWHFPSLFVFLAHLFDSDQGDRLFN